MEDAIKTLMAFFEAMNKWEVKWNKLLKGQTKKNETLMLNSLSEIYEKFLSKKERKRGRLAEFHIRSPPDYDLNQESINFSQFINNKKVSIETFWQHPANDDLTDIHRFTLVNIKGEWRIHKKETFCDDKWDYEVL
jgi:hypothetical protein